MKTKFKLTRALFKSIKHFNQDEQGVYAVMTALLAFPLLFLIAFTVDGTGALLDRTRLAQATDQATLLLITEDNANRDHKRDGDKHKDLITQDVSKEREEAKKNGSPFNTLDAQVKKRNQQLVQGLVKLYLRSDDSLASKNSSPVTIPGDFLAECKENTDPLDPNGKRKDVACTVQGTVQRKFILPWSHDLVSPEQLKDGRLAVNSGQAYVIKERQLTVPIELIMVTDLSRSMVEDLNGKGKEVRKDSKITILRDVVRKIENILLPVEPKSNVSQYNRIGFVTFAEGAREKDETHQCVLPYKLKTQSQKIRIHSEDSKRLGVDLSQDCRREKLAPGYEVNACYTRSTYSPNSILSKALATKSGGHSLWASIELMFDEILDVDATLKQIETFNGNKVNYPFKFEDGAYCLKDNDGKKTTQAWFHQGNRGVADALDKIIPYGGTAVTSGMLIGTNLLMDKNTAPEAQPEVLGTNTRRILLVLSDGEDNAPGKNTLLKLMEKNLCDKIRNQVNKLQDDNYPKQETQIHFVAFGYNPQIKAPKQYDAWNQCGYYHYASTPDDLFETFKQIISFEEEVGRSSSQKPKLFQ
ncbi:pilus assembly protein TadG-related protein [Aggregatibacter aphrophilus]|uniref:Putative Flp pilus-assembly TadG-like N-terminal domain-containing protein n=1 Tax=Aggregatibacter aphrophilus TaxID=732 RepID=A0AAP7GXZ9_AGGAP|nr:pilus assembly protein TadG-related protein [Aggregatibacter aphrophilus]OBY53987.1 hypothetical protein BBB52_00590 [Aggregatibacter aphrophilus]